MVFENIGYFTWNVILVSAADKATGHFLNLHQSQIPPSSVFLLYPPTKGKKKEIKKGEIVSDALELQGVS